MYCLEGIKESPEKGLKHGKGRETQCFLSEKKTAQDGTQESLRRFFQTVKLKRVEWWPWLRIIRCALQPSLYSH